ncbi:MAG: cytochrome c oxidase assembly protein [Thermoleophilia bacterium]|nr:cytochrome c oxidase assembly protein [Thermoleophilia bacterium]
MDVLTEWTLEPFALAAVLLAAVAYASRARTLARRGSPVGRWRAVSFGTGLALALLALVSPLHALGEERLFSAHMLQHVLLGDLAALAVVAGLTGPLLRPLLALRAVAALRALAHPLVALPLWIANLLLWHLPALYEAALRHEAVHVLEHVCFFGFGALMWAPVLEVLPGPAWFGTGAKVGYIVVVRLVETVLGNVFFWAGSVFYSTYAAAERVWGISPLADQGIAGGIMMIEGSLVTLGALAWLFLRMWSEGERRQELLERGLDPRVVNRAVRYGRAEDLP